MNDRFLRQVAGDTDDMCLAGDNLIVDLDLSEANGKPIDLVIGMKFPAYLVAHERKVLWIMHQYRSAYNLWGTPFDDLSTYPEGPQVR